MLLLITHSQQNPNCLCTGLVSRVLRYLLSAWSTQFPIKSVIILLGRCARAGKSGQAYSLVTRDEMCYLLDLHLFLGHPFSPVFETPKADHDTDGLFGIVPQLLLEEELGNLTSWYTSSIDVVSSN